MLLVSWGCRISASASSHKPRGRSAKTNTVQSRLELPFERVTPIGDHSGRSIARARE